MKKNKKLIVTLFSCFILFQVKALNLKKETLPRKVSFFKFKRDTTIISEEYSKIKEFLNNKNYSKSLELSLKLLDKYSDTLDQNNISFLFRTNIVIGDIYGQNNNHYNSIKYYKIALKYLKNSKLDNIDEINFEDRRLAKIYLRLGSEYLRLRNNKFRKDLNLKTHRKDSIKYKDSAMYYFNKNLNISNLDPKILSFQGSASSNLSGIYMQDSLYDKAKEYAKKAISIHKKSNKKTSEAAALGNLAGIHLDLNDYELAKSTYKKALDLIKHDNSQRALTIRENLYYNLAYNLYQLKDHEAYAILESSYEIKDDLRDKEIRSMIEELGLEYNFDVKKEVLEKELENKRLREQRLFFIIGAIAILIIASLIYYLNFYKLKQKNLGLKLQKTELLKNKELEKLKSESQVRILNATLDGKETERKEIAETLHDSVSALLSSANLHLQATRKQFNGATPLEIDKTQEIITEASDKIRDLSHALVSSVLLKFGLNFAIKDIADKYSNSDLIIDTDIKEINRYSQKFEIKVYNIIQELINNVLKHSKASIAKINLQEIESTLFIEIIDDGIGFDKTIIDSKDGLGINQIDARIQMMKGNFYIDSSFNKGTIVKIELPVLEREMVNLS